MELLYINLILIPSLQGPTIIMGKHYYPWRFYSMSVDVINPQNIQYDQSSLKNDDYNRQNQTITRASTFCFKNLGKAILATGTTAISTLGFTGLPEVANTIGSTLVHGPSGLAIDKAIQSISTGFFPGINRSLTMLSHSSQHLFNSYNSPVSGFSPINSNILLYSFTHSASLAGISLLAGAGGTYLTYILIQSIIESKKSNNVN